MQCPCQTGEGTEIMLAYLGGRLERDRRSEFETHLEECPACRELFEAQQAVGEALDEWEPAPVSAGFDRKLFDRIAADGARRNWWRRVLQPWPPKPAVVAATACLILVAGILMRPAARVAPPPVATAETVDIELIEQAAEDLEMLYVLDPATQQESEPPAEEHVEEGAGVVTLSFGQKRCV